MDEAKVELLLIPKYDVYAPVVDIMQNDDNFAAVVTAAAAAREAKLASYRILGNVVTFGRYEQDNSTANGPEPIEWVVLDVQDGKALLLSQYGLDARPYNSDSMDMTWEKCTLRGWLNSEFLKSSFSAEEQVAILTTEVDNSASQGYSKWQTEGGNNTQDQIFLLSYAEANRYLDITLHDIYKVSNNIKARVAPTAYAIAQGAETKNYQTADGDAAGWWWLRSPGSQQYYAASIIFDGSLLWFYSVDSNGGVVRPAFWLNLESGIF